jgi:hypothetical protein
LGRRFEQHLTQAVDPAGVLAGGQKYAIRLS